MKKIILLALCLVLGSAAFTGCSDNSTPFEKKTYTSDTQINEINLDVRDREIEVSLSEDEHVHIQYFENGKEYYNISVSDKNVLTMASAGDKEWKDYIGGKPSAEKRKISLQIPDALLENLTLSTTVESGRWKLDCDCNLHRGIIPDLAGNAKKYIFFCDILECVRAVMPQRKRCCREGAMYGGRSDWKRLYCKRGAETWIG